MQKLSRQVFGSNNIDNCSRYCQAPATKGLFRTVGHGGDSGSIDDLEKATMTVLIGTNTAEAHPVIASRIKRAQKLFGQRMHVFDIRKHEMAERADEFYQPKPGTDLAWLGAVTKYIIDHDLHDKAFLDEWVDDFEKYYESLAPFTMAFAEEATGIPQSRLINFAKEVAKAEEVANSADFKAKLPDGAKDVEVGTITEEVLATITSEAGTNKGTVKVPVTYTVDGVKYTKDAEITVNVVGSNADPVYVVEGDKPEVAKVKDAVTPGQGGTVQEPTEADLPDTKAKVGATDVTVPTKVKYANGEETVKVPVTVLPKVTPEGVTVLKDSDKQELEKAIKEQAEKAANNVKGLPSGVTATVTEVKTGTVPPTATVGVQIPATVVVEYVKDGKVVATKEVPVPVNVVEVVPVSIETPVTSTPLTPEDYTKGIKIPEGGKVTNVENIPDLTTPGKKDPVKVTVELPNGKTITVDVPVNVTPVKEIETPVTNTPLTPEDYTKGIKIPEGGKVTNVANIPDLTTPGKKDPVKVTIELPNGKVITVEVPVTVISKENRVSIVKTTTSFVDGNGNPVSPNEEGNQPKKDIPGYEFVKTTTDKDGNVSHVYRKVVPAAPKQEQSKPAKELPNTGTEDHSSLAALGLLGVLSGFGLVARKKKED